jgi:hypothetical protein
MMKKFLMFMVCSLLLGGIAMPSFAQTSVGLNYYWDDIDYTDHVNYQGNENGYGVELSQTFGRFMIGLDYNSSSIDKIYNSRSDSSLYAAHFKDINFKLGYRVVNGTRLKLDTNYVYNYFSWDVDKDNDWVQKMKSSAIELKATYLFSQKITAELAYAGSIASSGSDNYNTQYSDESYSSIDGRLNYVFSNNYSAYLGYSRCQRDIKYSNYSSTTTTDGLYAGIKYTFNQK